MNRLSQTERVGTPRSTPTLNFSVVTVSFVFKTERNSHGGLEEKLPA